MAVRLAILAVLASALGGVPALAGTSVVLGGPFNSALTSTGYNNYGAAAGYAAGNAAASAVQPATPPPQGGQAQNYANMVNNQGAGYGKKAKDEDASKPKSKYHYDQSDANDPLANVALPDRLFHNDEPHYYHGDCGTCTTAGPY